MACRHLLLSSVLTVGLCVTAPYGRVTAQPDRATTFVYRHAGQPAAGLRIIQRLPDGDERVTLTDGEGRATLTPRARVRIEDPAADDAVLDGFTVEATVPERRLVAEAIRLSGTIAAEAPGAVKLQYGFGRRVTARTRFRSDWNEVVPAVEEDRRLFGLEIPTSPHAWRDVKVNPDGTFLTPWFAGADDAQLLATTRGGRVAVEDVPLSAATPRATMAAPPLRFVQTRTLALDVRGRRRKEPTDVELYLRGARWPAEHGAFIARYLSVLDRIDVRTFTFASTIRAYVVGLGASSIPWLPPFSEVDLRLMGAVMGPNADVTLPLPDSPATLALDVRQVLPKNAKTLPFSGTVVFDRTYAPAADATVVFNCSPDRFETTTDRFGNFVIPAACVGREATLLATASDTASPARFAPAQKTQTVVHRAGDVRPLVIVLPFQPLAVAGGPAPVRPEPPDLRPSTLRQARRLWVPHTEPIRRSGFWSLVRSRPMPPGAAYRTLGEDNGDGAPRVLVYRDGVDGAEYNNVLNTAWVNKEEGLIGVEVADEGTWRVRVEESICFVGENPAVDFTESRRQVFKVSLIEEPSYNLWLTVFLPGRLNLPVDAGVPIYFPSYIEEPDPAEEETDRNGVVRFATCAMGAINVFVATENVGYFNGEVPLDWRNGGIVMLASSPPWDEDLPARPAAPAAPLPPPPPR